MIEILQGSPEWKELRRGKATGSRIIDVMSTIKSGEAAGRKNYRVQLALERVTGIIEDTFKSGPMEHGNEWEPVARALYEMQRGVEVDQVSFVNHHTIERAGASPDGLVNDDGCIEAKCPNTATHIETIQTRKVPRGYMLQMQWVMDCAERKWCDYISYDPRMPDHLRMIVIRIDRDDAMIAEIRDAVVPFLKDVADLVDALNKMTVD